MAALPKAEINRLKPHLSLVAMEQEETLLDGKAGHAYFVEQGIASVVVTVNNGNTVEVGIIGIDGVVGLPILLGTGTAPGRTFVQIAGSAYRIKAEILKEEFDRPGELRNHLQRYMQAFLVQTAQTAACNRLHNIEERLARWLLSCRDRMRIRPAPLDPRFSRTNAGRTPHHGDAGGRTSASRRPDRLFTRRGDHQGPSKAGRHCLRVLPGCAG